MSFILRRQKGMVFTRMARLAIVLFILSIAFSFIDTIWAVYLDSFVHSASIVGFVSSFLTLVSFVSFFFITTLIEKSSKTKLFLLSLFLFFISYLLFAINTNFYVVVVLAVVVTVLHTLRITSFGILVKEDSGRTQLSRNEGLMYTFMNLAWVVGPLIAGFISDKYGINLIFVLAAIFVLTSILFFKVSKIRDPGIKEREHPNVLRNFKDFFKDKERRLAYILGGGVNFWWSLIYLFIPVFIVESGFHIKWVGYFLFAIAIPLILFSYYFSKLAGKVGFKKVFRIGFLIPCLMAFICFFVGNIYLILLALVFASIGLAMLESTTESYFFDVLKGKEELRFYGPYNTAIDVNHFVSRLFSSVLLLLLPFKFIFLFYGLAMFVFFLLSFRVKNIVEKNRKRRR
ncbi:MAG: MFS transporter [archaeon]